MKIFNIDFHNIINKIPSENNNWKYKLRPALLGGNSSFDWISYTTPLGQIRTLCSLGRIFNEA